MIQTPPEELRVASREEKTRSREFVDATQECLQVAVAFGNGMPKEPDRRCVGTDPPVAHGDASHSTRDGVRQLLRAIVSVHATAQGVAFLKVVSYRGTDRIAAWNLANRRALQYDERLANVESQPGHKETSSDREKPLVRGARRGSRVRQRDPSLRSSTAAPCLDSEQRVRVMGPIPAIALRSSMQLLPTIFGPALPQR